MNISDIKKLNIALVVAKMIEKEQVDVAFNPDAATGITNYAEIIKAWKPDTESMKTLYEEWVRKGLAVPLMYKEGDKIRVPSSNLRDVIYDESGDKYVIMHQKDILFSC